MATSLSTEADDQSGWLSVRQAARDLGVVSRTVHGLINAGKLPGYRIGRVIRILRGDLTGTSSRSGLNPGRLTTCAARARPN
jgi:excisionase family DNA binding protein